MQLVIVCNGENAKNPRWTNPCDPNLLNCLIFFLSFDHIKLGVMSLNYGKAHLSHKLQQNIMTDLCPSLTYCSPMLAPIAQFPWNPLEQMVGVFLKAESTKFLSWVYMQ